MRVYEIGLIRNDKLLLTKKYYDEPVDDVLSREWYELLCITFMKTIKDHVKYNYKIISYEMLKYHVSMIGKKNGDKSKFISYLISDKDLGIDITRNKLKNLLNEFFKKFPPPTCYNINKNAFNGFYKKVDQIIGDLSMNSTGRLTSAF